MPLRKATLKGLTVLAMAVGFVVSGQASSANERQNGPGQDASSLPQARPTDSMAQYQGLIVSEIHFPGTHSDEDQKQLLEAIPQRIGAPLDRELVRESLRKLYATGRFADLRAEVERTSQGVSLSFTTTANYFIGEVNVEGLGSRPSASQVTNASKLQLGELFTREKMDRALSDINRLMQENGFFQSSVTDEEHRDPDQQLISVLFRIRSGPPAKIGRVNVTGNAGFSRGQIQDIAKMHAGKVVSLQQTSNALDRLRKKYQKQGRLLAQVSVASQTYRPEGNVVDYTFDIAPGPRVSISAVGFRVRRGVLKRNVPVFEENAADDDLLNEGRRNLLNYLQGRGYFEAKVTLKKQSDSTGSELRIIYAIDAGARHRLAKLEIQGNKYFLTEQLRSRMQVQPAGRFFQNGRYSQALLEGDVSGLQTLYQSNGFQQIKISSNVIDDYQGRENEIAVRLVIDEGPQTLVGKFQMEGNETFSLDELRTEINTAEGQPYSEYYIAQDRDNLLNYYYNRGFPHATFEATAKPAESPPNRMDVTFVLHEGERVFVGKVHVAGLHYTHPIVVQRELQVNPGDPLSQIDMLQTQQHLYDLGIFARVDTAVENPDGAEPQKRILIDAKEAKRYTFNYGIGLEFQTGQPAAVGSNQALGETGVSPRASLGVTRLNFRGRNHTITFKADVGSLQQRGLVSYNAPRWFNSRDWRLSLTAFYDNTLDVTTFTSQRLEGSIQAEQIVSKATTMNYRFTYRRVKASDIEISPAEIPLLSLPVRVGEPGFSYIRNKRDNDLETTKGSYTTVDAGVASSYFGSEADFSRLLAQNSTYHAFGKNRPPEKKFVFARSLRLGLENSFGNTVILPPGQSCPDPTQTDCPNATVIPLAERFLSGGGNSHRGFGLNQAGPRDPITGFPLGGSALFLNNVELRFPPRSLPFFQDNLSFAIFEDAGNVFTDGREMLNNLLRWRQKDPGLCLQASTAAQCDFSYVSHAIGLGVHYKTPIGPVRFDFGYNLNPPAFPSCQAVPRSSDAVPDRYCTQVAPTLPYFVPQHASHFNVFFSIGQTF